MKNILVVMALSVLLVLTFSNSALATSGKVSVQVFVFADLDHNGSRSSGEPLILAPVTVTDRYDSNISQRKMVSVNGTIFKLAPGEYNFWLFWKYISSTQTTVNYSDWNSINFVQDDLIVYIPVVPIQ